MKKALVLLLSLFPAFLLSFGRVNLNEYGNIEVHDTSASLSPELYEKDNRFYIEVDGLVMEGNTVHELNSGYLTLTTDHENIPSVLRFFDHSGRIQFEQSFPRIINLDFSPDRRYCGFYNGEGITVLDLEDLKFSSSGGTSCFSLDNRGITAYWEQDRGQIIYGERNYPVQDIVSGIYHFNEILLVDAGKTIWRIDEQGIERIRSFEGRIFTSSIADGTIYIVERSVSKLEKTNRLWSSEDLLEFKLRETNTVERKISRSHSPIPCPLNYDQAAYPFDVGNSYAEIQQYGYSPYLHPGVDFLGDDYQEVYAVKPGYVKAVLTTGGDPYWRVAIADENTSATCEGYLYAHLNQSSITVAVGDTVDAGELLGTLYPWGFADFTHIHFARLEDSGTVWNGNWWTIDNPHVDVTDLIDITPPVFENSFGSDFFAFRTDSGTYLDPDDLSGSFDIISKCHDICNSNWKIDVWDLYYTLHPAEQPDSIVFSRFAYAFDMPLDTYFSGNFDNMVLNTIYSRDNTCFSIGNYDEREYYHIITNSDGDSVFTEDDADEIFHSDLFIDGYYVLTVTARDASLNESSASMTVYFNNGVHTADNLVPESVISMPRNFPNPFNPSTTINFRIRENSRIALEVFNLKGELVDTIFEGFLMKGSHDFLWEPEEKPSGIYLYRLKHDNGIVTRKMTLLK